ncbi:MAG TPA: hypothetical protein VK433_00280 [Stellaceae bacterium]|nr:hypothetical protein [Stellaceae bacterium]
MRASSISTSTRSLILLKLATAVVLVMSAAHAQNATNAIETGRVDGSQTTAAAINSGGTTNRAGVNAGNATVITNADGAGKSKAGSAQVVPPAPAAPSEPTPWHPLTDY